MKGEILISKTEEIEKVCPCCNNKYKLSPLIEQPLCNRCYDVAMKMLFSGLYDDLSASEFKMTVKKEVELQEIKESAKSGESA
ncbi:MAG: hypothetical protein J6T31_00830 [Methanobrevibacter sp.]|nr:hypothetical protein [Methanobrevibacter sp.]